MLDQKIVFEVLQQNGVRFFTGVPDSYLNGFCNFAIAHYGERNVIAANEGNAVSIAAGHYFATKEIPLVFMQNSGMGNAVNPLVSLADKNVYAVPMLFFAVSCMEKQRFRIKRRINLLKFRIKRILLLFTVFPINKKAAFLL